MNSVWSVSQAHLNGGRRQEAWAPVRGAAAAHGSEGAASCSQFHSDAGSVTASRMASAAATTAGNRSAGSSGTRTRTTLRPDS